MTLKWLALRVARLDGVEMQRVISWTSIKELAILLSFAERSEIRTITSNLTRVGRENLFHEMKNIKNLKISDGAYAEIGRKIAGYVHLSLKGDSYKNSHRNIYVRPMKEKDRSG